jgi:transposase-like protein
MRRPAAVPAPRSSFAGFRFPREVIMLAVRWYLRYGLSYREVAELLAERGIVVDHVTIYRWVQRFTPELIDAARPSRHVTASDRRAAKVSHPYSNSGASRRTWIRARCTRSETAKHQARPVSMIMNSR